jgi:hypothetical protein
MKTRLRVEGLKDKIISVVNVVCHLSGAILKAPFRIEAREIAARQLCQGFGGVFLHGTGGQSQRI